MDEILDLIESVSGGFPTYSWYKYKSSSVSMQRTRIVSPTSVCGFMLLQYFSDKKSCPLYNLNTAKDIFMKLGTNIKHYKTMCKE